tara:strand:- start:9445 stop:9828 length:384 start_codon:yes stop_codon:yes gene_type:complete
MNNIDIDTSLGKIKKFDSDRLDSELDAVRETLGLPWSDKYGQTVLKLEEYKKALDEEVKERKERKKLAEDYANDDIEYSREKGYSSGLGGGGKRMKKSKKRRRKSKKRKTNKKRKSKRRRHRSTKRK